MNTFVVLTLLLGICSYSQASLSISPKVVNGIEAVPHEFSFLAAVIVQRQDAQYFFGGTLVSRNYILTSAQACVNALKYLIYLGAHEWTADEPYRVEITANGEDAVIHEYFDPKTLANDICVIKLSEAAPENNPNITIAQLPEKSNQNLYLGYPVITSGWGSTSGSAELSPVLRYIKDEVTTNQYCNSFYDGKIGKNHICTVGRTVSPCNGDIGGPLFLNMTFQPQTQIGIFSYIGIESCNSLMPIIYTKINPYLSWIESNTDAQIHG